MKNRILLIGFILLVFTLSVNAQQDYDVNVKSDLQEKVFTVYGNCGMCEKTIEGSLKNVEGVEFADWDKETDQIKVSYNPETITLETIKQKIADVGYDSDTHRAKDEVYNSLPGCCQYDRPNE
jgi:copper chaperone CopZ